MNTEELLKPRYKVIADYPGRPLTMPIGHILTLDKFGASKWWHEYTDAEPIHIDEGSTKYPAILKPLAWWEDRKPEEMPKYVKTKAGNSVRIVKEIIPAWDRIILDGGKERSIKHWFPATEEEYLTHKGGSKPNQ